MEGVRVSQTCAGKKLGTSSLAQKAGSAGSTVQRLFTDQTRREGPEERREDGK